MNINEKYGIIEFENDGYNQTVSKIVNDIMSLSDEDFQVALPEFQDILFSHKTYDFSYSVNWLETLDVYVSNSRKLWDIIGGYGLAVNADEDKLKKYVKVQGNVKQTAVFVYLTDQPESFYLGVMHHELAHIFDLFHQQISDGKDLVTAYSDTHKLPKHFDDSLTNRDIKSIVDFCMLYANISEKHAYLETINYDIIHYLSTIKIFQIHYKVKSSMFLQSSIYVNDLNYCLDCLDKIISLNSERLEKYIDQYGQEIEDIFSLSFLKVLKKFKKTIFHTYQNSMKPFTYYWELFRLDDNVNETLNYYGQWHNRRHKFYGL